MSFMIEKKSSQPSPQGTVLNNNIREKLNSHVKRRLQQDLSGRMLSVALTSNDNSQTDNENKEDVKPPKRKERRTGKISLHTDDSVPKKKRAKIKSNEHVKPSKQKFNGVEANAAVAKFETFSCTSAGIEDERSRDELPNYQETDKIAAICDEKKFPELLNMVLNAKKQALFRDPDVINFLKKVMDVFKG